MKPSSPASILAARICSASSLSMNEGLVFSACGNTMKKMAKKTGTQPVLIDGIKVVQAGVLRIMELQQKGWAYVRP